MREIALMLIVTYMLVLSCNNANRSYEYRIIRTGEISFPLDNKTIYKNRSIQFLNDLTGNDYFTLLNEYNNTLYLYNYNTTELIRKIELKNEGPNSKGNVQYHYIKNMDSIFLINSKREFILTNDEGKNIFKYPAFNFDYQNISEPLADILFTNTLRPLQFINDKIYLNGVIFGDLNCRPTTEFSLVNHQFKPLFYYPLKYKYDNGRNLLLRSFAYSTTTDITGRFMLYSFATSECIYLTNHVNLVDSFIAASDNDLNIISEFKKQSIPRDELEALRKQSGYYAGIVTDKDKNLYYRMAVMPQSDNNAQARNMLVSIFNKEFKKVGESLINGDELYEDMYFVNQNGLHICNLTKSMNNEDSIYFNIFLPELIREK